MGGAIGSRFLVTCLLIIDIRNTLSSLEVSLLEIKSYGYLRSWILNEYDIALKWEKIGSWESRRNFTPFVHKTPLYIQYMSRHTVHL